MTIISADSIFKQFYGIFTFFGLNWKIILIRPLNKFHVVSTRLNEINFQLREKKGG